MTSDARAGARTALARAGFAHLVEADDRLVELAGLTGLEREQLLDAVAYAANPDAALHSLVHVARRDAAVVTSSLADDVRRVAVWRLLGASRGYGAYYARHPAALAKLGAPPARLSNAAGLRLSILEAVGARDGVATVAPDEAVRALRREYRDQVAQIALYDLSATNPLDVVEAVSAALADAAGAALDAALAVARARVGGRGPGTYPAAQVAQTRLAIIGMGKAGARELNYVSDVDVIFVGAAGAGTELDDARALDIATRLASITMSAIGVPEIEPALWEVDANLRPEGKQGALVRSLASHLAYYDRWASAWEFQALLKARPLAGDRELGDAYVEATRERVWERAKKDNLVAGIQRMRERVTDHIPAEELAVQLKLGPGGIRDIEFTVQLIQLVHGVTDEQIRTAATLESLRALVDRGYIGRTDGATFSHDYRVLRLLEHRVQLFDLARSHLMPQSDDGLRALARSTKLADSPKGMQQVWQRLRREVRGIHERLFYRPLLSAVASLEEQDLVLTTSDAKTRLAAIGFRDPGGALRHIEALTSGLNRKVAIQRQLMSVMLIWLAGGVDPDAGLLAYRRISDRLGETPWFLRMLRDSMEAAEHLMTLLSGSRYIGALMEWIPESVAWLDSPAQLRQRTGVVLESEAHAIRNRHGDLAETMHAIRTMRRRELLRDAVISVVGDIKIADLAQSLTTVTEVTLQAALGAVRAEVLGEDDQSLEFAIIGMGRFGGAELGIGSDADVMYVYRAGDVPPERAATLATKLVNTLRDAAEDLKVPLELDADLRPEGRNGPIVRSLDAYAEYYRRWLGTWEVQALLRARGVAGTSDLVDDFMRLADEVRYPRAFSDEAAREVRRIKARVESERMPQNADRKRHLKLGPGGLSDVEWLVQLIQLQHAAELPALRTTSTIGALRAAREAGHVSGATADLLDEAWHFASRLRTAHTLVTGSTSDFLPTDRQALDGIGRILNYPPGSATEVEDDWLRTARKARKAFEEAFYDA